MNGIPPANGAIPDFNFFLLGAIVALLIVAAVIWVRRRLATRP